MSGRLFERESTAAQKVSGRLFERESTVAQEDEWTALQKRVDSGSGGQLYDREEGRKVSGQFCKRESTSAQKVSGRFCERESTAALKWSALRQRGLTAIGSLIERLDRACGLGE